MNRRESLRLLTLSTFTPFHSFPADFTLFKNNENDENTNGVIDPVTAITIGLTAAKLFSGMFQSSNGPTIIDFIKNTNEQLNIISKKIDLLIEGVAQLQGLIQELPTDVVSKLKQVELKARVDDYRAVLFTVSHSYKGNILEYMAIQENKNRVLIIANRIAEIKTELQQLNDAFLVPYVAIAIHVEYYLRNNFLQQKWKNFIGNINNDAIWLNDYVFQKPNSIKNNINTLRSKRIAILADNHNVFSVSNGRLGQENIYWVRYDKEIDTSIIEDQEILKLRELGLLLEYEKPQRFLKGVIIKNYYTGYVVNTAPEFPEQPLDPLIDRIIAPSSNNLRLNYYSLIASAASFYAGLKAIEFCNIYLKADKYTK